MSDRHAGYVVALERDIKDEDAEAVISALRHIKGVLSVEPVVGGVGEAIAAMRVEGQWRSALVDLITKGVPRA